MPTWLHLLETDVVHSRSFVSVRVETGQRLEALERLDVEIHVIAEKFAHNRIEILQFILEHLQNHLVSGVVDVFKHLLGLHLLFGVPRNFLISV